MIRVALFAVAVSAAVVGYAETLMFTAARDSGRHPVRPSHGGARRCRIGRRNRSFRPPRGGRRTAKVCARIENSSLMGRHYIFAGLNLHFRDLQRIMSILMLAWVYASPVFIPISRIPEKYLWVYDVNPMARILMTWRDAFYQPAFHPERFAANLAVSLAAFVVGRWIFMKLEPRAAEMM